MPKSASQKTLSSWEGEGFREPGGLEGCVVSTPRPHLLKSALTFLSSAGKPLLSDSRETRGQEISPSSPPRSLSVAAQSLSRVWLFATPWTAARQASLSITNSRSLFKLMSMESVMPSKHLILCRPLLLPPSIFPSIRVFSNESALHIRWPKDWSFSFGISPSNEHPGLISFRMDWLDLLAVQGTLKGLLQPQFKATNSSVLILYGPTLTSIHDGYWKNHTLTRWTFVAK